VDALIVYGSLINESELIQHEFPLDSTYPVIVQGFKRVFSQEPSWRSDQGENRAVLNVFSSEHYWLNALLISDLSEDFLVDVDKREKGYDRIRVDPSSLRAYHPHHTAPAPQNIYIHSGKTDKQSNSILPNPSYLDICLEGAKRWGEDFYTDFLDSTFVSNEISLRTYIEQTG
jgi:hypothetical protein